MFDKLKKMKQLKDLKASMDKENATVEKDGVEATVSGSMQVTEVKLNPDLAVEKQQKLVKQCVNEAFKKVQRKVAEKMQEAQQ